MGASRASLVGGAAYLSFGTYVTDLLDDGKFDLEGKFQDIESTLRGKVDEVQSDLLVKISGTPLTFDVATTPAALYPYLTAAPGSFWPPTTTDTPASLISNNGDTYQATCGVITKLADITLGADKPTMGGLEITGVIGNAMSPETTASYYTVGTAAFTRPTIDKSKILRGAYSWAWGSVTGFAPFEFEEPPVISFDLKLEPVTVQGRTIAFRFISLLAMLKGKPVGPTAAQILSSAKLAQGTGATHGHKTSLTAADLVGTGPMAVTLKNAALKSAGFVFGDKPLRNGEIGFLTTIDTSTSANGPILTFA